MDAETTLSRATCETYQIRFSRSRYSIGRCIRVGGTTLGVASIEPGAGGLKGLRPVWSLRRVVGVSTQFPRPLQFLRAAILAVESTRELERLRELARDEWGDHARYHDIEMLLERRAAEVEGRAGTQLALPLEL